jgi:dCTP deaminase
MILPAQAIRRIMPINPFHERTVHRGMSFGLSSAGYDVRIKETMILEPAEFRLASTVEKFRMPDNLIAMVHDKSTWARRGLSLFNTVIEPGWRGFLTLELVNNSKGCLSLQSGDPIAQIVFMRLDEATESPYAGKYQDQPSEAVPALQEARND